MKLKSLSKVFLFFSDHHVHFDAKVTKDEFESDSCVTYQRCGDVITVNLGFLQKSHRYTIDLKLPVACLDHVDLNSVFVPDVSSSPSLHCRITEFSGVRGDKECFEMTIEFFAYKEKLLKENLVIVNSKNSEECLKLCIAARVLGKGKGTPLLRTGIHCIGVEADEDESEASDYPDKK